jgi:hypothetical protein
MMPYSLVSRQDIMPGSLEDKYWNAMPYDLTDKYNTEM